MTQDIATAKNKEEEKGKKLDYITIGILHCHTYKLHSMSHMYIYIFT